MESSLRITTTSSASFDPPIEAQRAAFKKYLIEKYCDQTASAQIVTEFFAILPELRDA
jgi:hypothetical protein